MAVVGNLVYQISGDSSQLDSQLSKTDKQVSGLSKGIKLLGGAIAGAFAVRSIFSFGKSLVTSAGQFEQLNYLHHLIRNLS